SVHSYRRRASSVPGRDAIARRRRPQSHSRRPDRSHGRVTREVTGLAGPDSIEASMPPKGTTIAGYSDRINHALAFAAKHHDQQVRKGTRLPYLTHPANVAIILTRYGQDEETIVAGILHDVIEDCVSDGYTREMLESRVADKFGQEVLATVLAVANRKLDDDGIELSSDERKEDYLARLAQANDRARWVCAADKVHNASTILADLKRTDYP